MMTMIVVMAVMAVMAVVWWCGGVVVWWCGDQVKKKYNTGHCSSEKY